MSKYPKSTVRAEPLIWLCYAWLYLIPLATPVCNVVERYLKIMKSYVQNPQIHVQAIKNSDVRGGSFIDLEGRRVVMK